MEVGAHVWLRSPQSRWGWVPARIVDREEIAAASPAAASSAPSSSSTTRSFGAKKAKQMVLEFGEAVMWKRKPEGGHLGKLTCL